MSKRMGYPRNEAARRDRILQHEIVDSAARNILARNDMLATDPHQALVSPTMSFVTDHPEGHFREAEIVAGGGTLVITLTGDTWALDLGSDNALTTAFLAAITGDDAGASGWDDEFALVHGDLVRTSDTVMTINLPAEASYSVAANETVTVAPPAGSVAKGNAPAAVSFEVSTLTVALTGTAIAGGVTEAQMVTGGETLIVTLTGDTYHADIGADNAITTAFLAGILGDDDYATIAALTDFGDVARTSATIVTLTWPAGGAYTIAADETVGVTLPASALALGFPPADGSFTITEGA